MSWLYAIGKWIAEIAVTFILGVAVGAGGLLYWQHEHPEPLPDKTVIEEKDKNKFTPKDRDYPSMTETEIAHALYKAEHSDLEVNWKVLSMTDEMTKTRMDWKLADVSGSKFYNFPVKQDSRFVYYVGIGGTCAVIAAYATYKIARR